MFIFYICKNLVVLFLSPLSILAHFNVLFFPGVYAFVASDKIRHPDEYVRLLSPTFEHSGLSRCLEFSYNVYGENVGVLNIKDQVSKLLWHYVGFDVLSEFHSIVINGELVKTVYFCLFSL